MKRRGIAMAGNLIVDHYKELDVYPEASNLAPIRGMRRAIGGAVCNSAIDLARMDPELPIQAIGVVGADEDGDFVLEKMSAYPGLDLSRIRRSGRTSFTDVMEDRQNLTRTFFQYMGANAELSADDFDFEDISAEMIHIGYILLLPGMDKEDSEYGTVMARVLAMAREAGLKTSIDVVSEASERFSRLVPPALRYCDYGIINEVEAGRTVGMELRLPDGSLDVEASLTACRRMLEMGVREWAIIHAREGAVAASSDGETCCLPSLKLRKEDVLSTTGAGDAFLAGSLYAAYRHMSLREACELGISCAASSLFADNATDGVRPWRELLEFYRTHPKENRPGFSDHLN